MDVLQLKKNLWYVTEKIKVRVMLSGCLALKGLGFMDMGEKNLRISDSRVRETVLKYQDVLYMVFAIGIWAMMSLGMGSLYLVYRITFVIGTLCIFIKIANTEYKLRELIWIVLWGGLLGGTLLYNHEKTLLLAYLVVIGAKNVNYEKVLKWALWVRLVCTVCNMTGSILGITKNWEYVLPKHVGGQSVEYVLYTYGYFQPNHTFWNVYTMVVIALMVYYNVLKWYHILGMHCVMYFMYRLVVCRAGWYTWLITLAMYLVWMGIQHYQNTIQTGISIDSERALLFLRVKKAYEIVITAIPSFMFIFAGIGMYAFYLGEIGVFPMGTQLNNIFTGRFGIAFDAFSQMKWTLIGQNPRLDMDLSYIYLLYNYGILVCGLGLIAYTKTLHGLFAMNKAPWAIGMAAICGYAIGEMLPLNAGWNITFCLMAITLYGVERNTK